MDEPVIDFHAIRPADGCQWKGFEHMVGDVCESLVPDARGGRLTTLRPPDGGLDAFITLRSGEIHGFQAKYLFALDRCARSKVKESLYRALVRYPTAGGSTSACHAAQRTTSGGPGTIPL